MTKVPLPLKVNGSDYYVEIEPHRTLLDVLREDLGFTGTKESCREGECGVCTVSLDNKTINSCLLPAVAARGKEIITVEGIAASEELHPIQKAFVDCHGLQCGFCTPGFIMSAKALLDENENPTEEEIRSYLAGNLCRCTGYNGIVDAVKQAASELRKLNKV
ncbi:(2Fe-2S)-binding protein [Peribacillus glennii]|uniref:(2Fe-2S)-binding protein n=1 Tax=Peribacillus glennii TaxID=2303991 RepID=A0A372LGP2_9BACI|nr:(2Fe-2S)-binding protein [Peribacillus glennii]RFU65154.1 (2Fe-2S)-binding protein [Peribacillus glennii]